MRNEVFFPHSLRLNAITAGIPTADDSDHTSVFGPVPRSGSVSTNPQNPQRERKKEAKKERESTTATIFLSKTGNYNCRQREIIIDARHKLHYVKELVGWITFRGSVYPSPTYSIP